MLSNRITLNSRLETAAAAIVHRIISRSRPREFGPVTCFMNGSTGADAMIEGGKRREMDNRGLPTASRVTEELPATVSPS
jgi:hypothetical protein